MYGLKLLGLVSGALGLFLVWTLVHLSFGLIASMPSYLLGSWVSVQWFKGKIQQWIYWNLPSNLFFKSKYIAHSKFRNYL